MNALAVTPREVEIMQFQEVVSKIVRGEMSVSLAAEMLRVSERSLRRHRARYRKEGVAGLRDRRVGRVPANRATEEEEEKVVGLYISEFNGWSVAHFAEEIRLEFGIQRSDTWFRKVLKSHGVGPSLGPDRHRRRRERRDRLGELVHIDGTRISWEGMDRPKPMLIVVVDDATGRVLCAQLAPEETTLAILTALADTVRQYGIPLELQTDRAAWAFNPRGHRRSGNILTQVGGVLNLLKVKHFPGHSPQGRGRGERMNRTIKERLVPELERAGITSLDDANRFIRDVFLRKFNKRFAQAPAAPESVFLQTPEAYIRETFSVCEKRRVGNDNVLSWRGSSFQIRKQPGNTTCAGQTVLVREYLDGTIGLWLDADHCVGRYHPDGCPLPTASENTHQVAA